MQAIERKQPVTFFYKDKWQPEGTPGALGQRVGNPHAIWKGANGRTYLHLYVDPQSATATGGLPGWRTFLVNRIQGVSVLELGTTFLGQACQVCDCTWMEPLAGTDRWVNPSSSNNERTT